MSHLRLVGTRMDIPVGSAPETFERSDGARIKLRRPRVCVVPDPKLGFVASIEVCPEYGSAYGASHDEALSNLIDAFAFASTDLRDEVEALERAKTASGPTGNDTGGHAA